MELNVHQWKECQNNKYLLKVNTQSENLCILVGIEYLQIEIQIEG